MTDPAPWVWVFEGKETTTRRAECPFHPDAPRTDWVYRPRPEFSKEQE